MGQYLTIGLVTDICVDKKRAETKAGATGEEIKAAMHEAYNQSGIYSMEDTEDSACLSLRPEVAESELVDMLTDFYKLRYGDDDRVQDVMDEIKKRSTLDEWMELAQENRTDLFQQDPYVWLYTPYSRGWSHSLPTSAVQIALSIDGKIVMESYDELFKFFTRVIREKLSKYRLSAGLFVAITG